VLHISNTCGQLTLCKLAGSMTGVYPFLLASLVFGRCVLATTPTYVTTISPAATTTGSQDQGSCDFYAFLAPTHYYQGFTMTLSPVGKSDNDLFLYTSLPAQSECQTRSSAVASSADHSLGASHSSEAISVAQSTSYFTGSGQVRSPCCTMNAQIQSLCPHV
jgi:hypothetical protein